MKLDKIKFARVVTWIARQSEYHFNEADLAHLDDLISIDVNEPSTAVWNAEDLNRLLFLMQEGQRKIEAIKQYRVMTGHGLKEAKDSVEKYWVSKPSKDDIAIKINQYLISQPAGAAFTGDDIARLICG